MLGAIDDGKGHWALGWDDKHPQNSGHHEFLYSFVPSLFEALEQGKPNPVKAASGGFARITSGAAPLTFAPAETMHPFALSIMVRTQNDGTLAAIIGSTLATRTETRQNEEKPFTATTLIADKSFAASLAVQNGKFGYKPAAGTFVDSGVRADTQWHNVALSHFTARGETLIFVDGKLTGKVAERLEPNRFVVGGPGATGAAAGPRQADYKDMFLVSRRAQRRRGGRTARGEDAEGQPRDLFAADRHRLQGRFNDREPRAEPDGAEGWPRSDCAHGRGHEHEVTPNPPTSNSQGARWREIELRASPAHAVVEADRQVGLPAYKPEEVQPRNEEGDEDEDAHDGHHNASRFTQRLVCVAHSSPRHYF